jgi:NADH dehydrogenase/NADH:ubiquinone oxidoreductase subunit G
MNVLEHYWSINVRENRKTNQEWTIQKQRHQWGQATERRQTKQNKQATTNKKQTNKKTKQKTKQTNKQKKQKTTKKSRLQGVNTLISQVNKMLTILE